MCMGHCVGRKASEGKARCRHMAEDKAGDRRKPGGRLVGESACGCALCLCASAHNRGPVVAHLQPEVDVVAAMVQHLHIQLQSPQGEVEELLGSGVHKGEP